MLAWWSPRSTLTRSDRRPPQQVRIVHLDGAGVPRPEPAVTWRVPTR